MELATAPCELEDATRQATCTIACAAASIMNIIHAPMVRARMTYDHAASMVAAAASSHHGTGAPLAAACPPAPAAVDTSANAIARRRRQTSMSVPSLNGQRPGSTWSARRDRPSG
jgi:hypothetical protein